MARKRRRNSRALLATAALAGFCSASAASAPAPSWSASGTMTAILPRHTGLHRQADRVRAPPSCNSLCSVLNLLDCYSVSAPAPAAFSRTSGGGINVTFAWSPLDTGVDNNGACQRVINGTHPLVDLTATKSSGIFPAGTIRARHRAVNNHKRADHSRGLASRATGQLPARLNDRRSPDTKDAQHLNLFCRSCLIIVIGSINLDLIVSVDRLASLPARR